MEDGPDIPSDAPVREPTHSGAGGAQTPGSGGPRASDADRDRFAKMLERHFVEGRLSEEEFSDRMDRVLRARSLVELYALSSDLPDPPAVEIPRSSHRRKRAWRFWRA
jgi:hypothetical protein